MLMGREWTWGYDTAWSRASSRRGEEPGWGVVGEGSGRGVRTRGRMPPRWLVAAAPRGVAGMARGRRGGWLGASVRPGKDPLSSLLLTLFVATPLACPGLGAAQA